MLHDLPENLWKKSSYSGDNGGGNCLEWQITDGKVALRDSKNPQQGAFEFSFAEWNAFVEGAKDGQFDL